MRRALLPALVIALGVSACGSGSKAALTDQKPTSTLSYGDQVRAAARTVTNGSSKIELLSETKASGQDVKIDGHGAFETVAGVARGEFSLSFLGKTIDERFLDGVLYMQVPGVEGFYKLKLSDLVGTQLADSANPTSSAQTLAAIDGVTKVGTAKVRGAETTQYAGTIDIAKALAKFKGSALESVISKFSTSGLSAIPVQVYLDGQGRLRRLTEHLTLTVQGQAVDSTTQLDIFDFGTKVNVVAPPADQVMDGAALLTQLKGHS